MRSGKTFSTVRCIRAALLLAGGVSCTAAAHAADLKYDARQGETYSYRMTIKVETPDAVETFSGTLALGVRSADGDTIAFRPHGNLARSASAKPTRRGRRPFPPRPPRIPSPPRFGGVDAEVKINRQGELLNAGGSERLPYLLGRTAEWIFAPLDGGGEKTWKSSAETDIGITSAWPPLPSSFRRRPDEVLKATEENVYTIESATGEQTTLARTYRLWTKETVSGEPRIELAGKATIVFDHKRGMPASMKFAGALFLRETNVTGKLPIEIEHKLLTEDEAKQLREAAEERRAELEKLRTLDEATVRQLAGDLKSDDEARRRQAAARLSQANTSEGDAEISKQLVSILKEEGGPLRLAMAGALEKWATAESADDLIGLLDSSKPYVRKAAIGALGRLKVEKAAEPLAGLLPELQSRFAAADALKKIGSPAEATVLKQAESGDPQVASTACQILKEIGTKKSLPALKTLAENPNGIVRLHARQAVQAIERRGD